jgi:L-lactate permease
MCHLESRKSFIHHDIAQVGTSTGAIIAVSMAVLRMDLDQVESIYTKLGQKVRQSLLCVVLCVAFSRAYFIREVSRYRAFNLHTDRY